MPATAPMQSAAVVGRSGPAAAGLSEALLATSDRDIPGGVEEPASFAKLNRSNAQTLGFFGRSREFFKELSALYNMPQEDVDAYFRSHEVMGQEKITNREDENSVIDWYRVLNHFCALGAVEKMYIPPVIDPDVGTLENQVLFEELMCRQLNVGIGGAILDLGCGAGRIAHEVATYSGAKVTGLNYDKSQVERATEFATKCNLLGSQLEFHYGSFNDPLPFANEAFGAAYEVGAFCYAIDKKRLFTEIHRVLKPGGRFSYCDWVRLKFDPENEHHQELLRQVKPLTGMVEMPFPSEVESAFKESGFEIEFSGESSTGGNQLSNLVGDVDRSFSRAECLVKSLTCVGLAPRSLLPMWEKIREGGEALQEAVDLDLFTMSWQIIARKPTTRSTNTF
mmetsp:Transcript_52337/g.152135  ORF Transcript_52337/g.152135 Transcript_52337/m.152135 type:complete len:394 (+) Transcript_52337:44-1225(+)